MQLESLFLYKVFEFIFSKPNTQKQSILQFCCEKMCCKDKELGFEKCFRYFDNHNVAIFYNRIGIADNHIAPE